MVSEGLWSLYGAVVGAFGALVGAVVGAVVGYWSSRKLKSMESQIKLKTDAYIDFVRGVVGVAFSQKNSDKIKESEYTTLLAEAKARISIYGDKEVVKRLAIFFDGSAKLDNSKSIDSFINAIQAMRRDSLPQDQSVPNDEIISLLFKPESDELGNK